MPSEYGSVAIEAVLVGLAVRVCVHGFFSLIQDDEWYICQTRL